MTLSDRTPPGQPASRDERCVDSDGQRAMGDLSAVEPLGFPLQGSHLIEASAGTGKTWTIAALYLRLVLGHGEQVPRRPADILVLTFTDAAAQELRDRIRTRLDEAAWAFAQSAAQPDRLPDDEFLAGLVCEHPPAQRAAAAQMLDLAAQSMDEAAISTIHSWCRRVLQEHAFESGSLFDWQMQTDLHEPIRLCVWDYWRTCVAGLPMAALQDVQQVWSGPGALLRACGGLLTRADLPRGDGRSLYACWQAHQTERLAHLAGLKGPWKAGADELRAWLDGEGSRCSLRKQDWRRWLNDLEHWAADPTCEMLDLKTGWERLSPSGLAEKCVAPLPDRIRALCTDLVALSGALKRLPSLQAVLYVHALAWLARRLQNDLERAGQLGFDGLLARLDTALAGDSGQALRDAVRRQFPVVLIDEFQDTDPVQYRIFDRVYRVAENDPRGLLVLIGDPKQSIYGFRGADVHTYLRAARACPGRIHTLDCNFRSAAPMVRAVNRCFQQAGPSAFPSGRPGEYLGFQPVRAHGLEHTWEIHDQPVPALSACWLEPTAPDRPWTLQAFDGAVAQACAHRIADWLAKGAAGVAGLRGPQGLQAIQAGDIAVLVASAAQAQLIRLALARAGLRSVYLSERDSVYHSLAAQDLSICLQACAEPGVEARVRAALATPLLGMSDGALERLVHDELAWDEQVERFQGYLQSWLRRGVLPMLRQLLHDFEVPARLLADGHDGERLLTDCLHLAELLQQESLRLDGPQALLHHLQMQCAETGLPDGTDARCLRLESDRHLIRVVTIHKSKGLEYPFVFLPFACRPSGRSSNGFQPYQLPDADGLRWVFAPDDDDQARQAEERLGEEVRKLYVGLTRARHAVWLALGPMPHNAGTGLGHLLGDDLRAGWQALVDSCAGAVGWDDPLPDSVPCLTATPEPAPGPVRQMRAPAVAQDWWIASYSAMQRESALGSPDPYHPEPARSADEDTLIETWHAEGRPDSVPDEPGLFEAADGATAALSDPWLDVLADFPRGSQAGTFLHGLLEWAARRDFKALDDARDMIARRCAVRGWASHIEALHAWLLRFAQTRWCLSLAQRPVLQLDALDACLPEMEFWMPVQDVDVSAIDALASRHICPGQPRPALSAARLNGMFKGFVDLVLQSEGRYYLVDYKSNHLGVRAADYDAPGLQAAMLKSRYDVQMMVYLLALHRQLRARLVDYDFARDMGGAVYMFLRGQECPGQGLFAFRPSWAAIDALDGLFAGVPAAAAPKQRADGS
ncbi:exodeoxyribonuclease V subunit beta [Castellaniella sp.]|uniref:exodeoxyribonuclease V subunit beta n=1 Tax=Castellaniella sp. TaxID=1955812 RepID=UPI00355F9846